MYNIYINDKNKCLPITYEQYDTDATCITIINLLWITVLNRKKGHAAWYARKELLLRTTTTSFLLLQIVW